jgi:hypothetical protein
MREGLLAVDLSPTQRNLAGLLVLESFDKDVVKGQVDLADWARRLRVRDARGVRPDKLQPVLKALVGLGLVNWNRTEGSFELRPAAEGWLAPRQGALGLRQERELDEAMCGLSREKVLGAAPAPPGAGGSVVRADHVHVGDAGREAESCWSRLRGAIDGNAPAAVFEGIAAGVAADFAADGGSAEKAAAAARLRGVAAAESAGREVAHGEWVGLGEGGAAGKAAIHGHVHDHVKRDIKSMFSMDHALAGGVAGRMFEVGALERKSGREIFDLYMRVGRPKKEFENLIWRRIGEDARVVWNLVNAARLDCSIKNPAGWLNDAYMSEKRLGRYAE